MDAEESEEGNSVMKVGTHEHIYWYIHWVMDLNLVLFLCDLIWRKSEVRMLVWLPQWFAGCPCVSSSPSPLSFSPPLPSALLGLP